MQLKQKKYLYRRVLCISLMTSACCFPVSGAWSQAVSEVAISPETAEPDAVMQPVPPSYEPADPAPDTLTALHYLPSQAQAALGIPSAAGLMERVVPFAQLFLKDLNLQEEIDLIASDLAKDMEVSDEGGIVNVLAAMGLDSQAGIAVFVDLEAVFKAYAEAMAQGQAPDGPDYSAIKALVVIPANNPQKAEASLLKLVGEMASGSEVTERQVEGVTVKEYGEMGGYFVNDAVLAVSNDRDMLVDAAKRAQVPALFQYGSTMCPPDDIHEVVVLMYGDRLLPFVDFFQEQINALDPSIQMLVKAEIERARKTYEGAVAQEPHILTAKVNEAVVELKSKVNTAVYPGFLDYMGMPTPLYWAPRLPDTTLAFLTLNLTEEFKSQLANEYLDYLPDDVRNSPGVSQGIMYVGNALQLLGGEVTLGVATNQNMQYPGVFLITRLSDSEGADVLLQMAPQADFETPYRDIQVKEIQAPLPLPVYFASIADALVISNSVEGIRGLIDLSKDGQTSGLFERLNPPIPVDIPLYQAFMVKLSLYADIVAPLMAITGQSLPGDLVPVLETVTNHFDTIRILNGVQGDWTVGSILASRKP